MKTTGSFLSLPIFSRRFALALLVGLGFGSLAGSACGDDTLTVPATANIYGAGHAAPPVAGYGGSGNLPPSVTFAAKAGQTLTITAATGEVLLDQPTNNAGTGPSGPDGGPFYAPTDVTSTGGLSGIKSNVTGFVTGVFLDDNEPTGAGPAVLDFTTAGVGTSFTSLAPAIGQVFFIGNGRTSSGAEQQFSVPATATRLFLGVVDAADGDNAAGPPQAYGDNGGSFNVTFAVGNSPAPAYGVVAWWPAENAGVDVVGGNQGTASGSLTYDPAKVGRSFNFDGLSAYLSVPDAEALRLGGDLTIEAWINPSALTGSTQTIVSKRDTATNDSTYFFNLQSDGRLSFSSVKADGSFINAIAASPAPVVPLAEFSHVAATLSATTLTLYLNGTAILTQPFIFDRPATTGPLTIGAKALSSGASSFFKGKIDELTFYDRVLSATEIAKIAAAGESGKRRDDPVRDFSSTKNDSDRRWQYGQYTGTPATFSSYAGPAVDNGNGLSAWGAGVPSLSLNTSDAQFSTTGAGGTEIRIAGKLIAVHPSSGASSVLRWKAPAAGSYAVSATFTGADARPTTTDVHVFHNTTAIFDGNVNTFLGVGVPFTGSIDAAAGDTVDFVVGPDGNSSFDNTGMVVSVVRLPAPPAPTFTLELKGLQDGQLLPPNTAVTLRAEVSPATIPDLTIQKVQFFVNGVAAGSPDLTAPYKYSTKAVAGEKVVTAVATDSSGGTITSAPLRFTVTPAGAGQIALQTEISPSGTTFAPGSLITYRFRATNTSKTAVAKGVKVVAPVPRGTKYSSSEAYDENSQSIRPKPAVAPDKRQVTFSLGDIPVGKTRRAELKVRVPYDEAAGGDPIRNSRVNITGTGFGEQPFTGNFPVLNLSIVGPSPANSPRLTLLKMIVDRGDDANDELDLVEDANLGPIPAAGPGDVLSFLLVVANDGGLPAEKITIEDRVPEGCQLVPGSVRVNDVSAGALATVNGRTVTFKLGDLGAGGVVTVAYQLTILERTAGGPLPNAIIYSVGAEVGSLSLRATPNSAPERLPIKVEPPVVLVPSQLAEPGTSEVGKPTTYTLKYRNEGNRVARNARITNPIPAGTTYKAGSAAIVNAKPGQTVSQPDAQTIVFNLGDVRPEESGEVVLTVDVTSAVLDLSPPQVVNRPYFGSPVQSPIASAVDNGGGPAEALESASSFFFPDFNPVADPTVPRMFLARLAPQSVQKGGYFTYTFVVGNMSDFAVEGNGVVTFDIPIGANFVASSHGNAQGREERSFNVGLDQLVTTSDGSFPAHSAASFTVTLLATAEVGKVIQDATCFLSANNLDATYVPTSATLVIEGAADAPTNQVAIAGAQLGALGLDASVALLDDRVAAAVGQINALSSNVRIGGAGYVQLTNGSSLIPLGNNQVVAMGTSALVAVSNGASLIGNDGSTLVAAGAGNLITFNGLVGDNGASLVGQDGGTLLSKIITGDPANLVAAGAGNLVAAGGGNLIGNDGSTLVGNDGASFGVIASLVAAGGGNLVAAGGGNLLGKDGLGLVAAGAGNFVIKDPASLVAAGGGNLVAAGGGNLLGAGGVKAVSRDASWAFAIGKNGAITVGGGGHPMVAAGAGN